MFHHSAQVSENIFTFTVSFSLLSLEIQKEVYEQFHHHIELGFKHVLISMATTIFYF